jgi:hypothetical protein
MNVFTCLLGLVIVSHLSSKGSGRFRRLRSAGREINMFSAATHPVNRWMSLVDCGGAISIIARILLGFALMLCAIQGN